MAASEASAGPVHEAHQLDESALRAYLKENVHGVSESGEATSFRVSQFGHGQSNPTYLVEVGQHRYVVRKKPPGKLLRSAHAVEREYQVLAALGQHTRVPVPHVHCLCNDPSVIGTPFYVMDFVQGRIFTDPKLPGVHAAERRSIYGAMADTLAALHRVDPREVGLGAFGRLDKYCARQVERWARQYEASVGGGGKPPSNPRMRELTAWLGAHVPAEDADGGGPSMGIVHGDFRLDNLVYGPRAPRVAAVLDWELATLGNQLSDLAYVCMPYHVPRGLDHILPSLWTSSGALPDGVPSEADFVAAYCAAAGTAWPAGTWKFYVALSLFRGAAIFAGVYARALQGNASSQRALQTGQLVDVLCTAALSVISAANTLPLAPPSSSSTRTTPAEHAADPVFSYSPPSASPTTATAPPHAHASDPAFAYAPPAFTSKGVHPAPAAASAPLERTSDPAFAYSPPPPAGHPSKETFANIGSTAGAPDKRAHDPAFAYSPPPPPPPSGPPKGTSVQAGGMAGAPAKRASDPMFAYSPPPPGQPPSRTPSASAEDDMASLYSPPPNAARESTSSHRHSSGARTEASASAGNPPLRRAGKVSPTAGAAGESGRSSGRSAGGGPGLGPSPRALELKEKLLAFMQEHVYPAEAVFEEHAASEGRWNIHPLLEVLKQKARAQGLWNLWIPADSAALAQHLLDEGGAGGGGGRDLVGAGLSNLEYAHLCEVMGRSVYAPEVFNCSAPDTGNMEVLLRYGSPAQQRAWLAPLLDGRARSCFAMTEPAVASSDATNITASIVRDGDEYVLTGRKWWTSGACDPRCRVAIFMGKTSPGAPPHRQQSMVLVDMAAPGVRVLRPLTVFGFDDAPHGHAEVAFDGVRVPRGNLLLGEGRGFEIAQGRLGPGRLHHCMRLIGAAERGLEAMAARALQRKAFGRALAEHGSVVETVAECRLEIEGARLLVLHAAHELDVKGNKAARNTIALAKVAAPRAAQKVLDAAIQLHGGGGVSSDFPLARLWAYARTLRLADGPDEVHLGAIGRAELAVAQSRL